MLPLSCVNCVYNGLQYDTLGTMVGYCCEHKCILTTPSILTCGRLLRKDLALMSAKEEQGKHAQRYAKGHVCLLRTGEAANGANTSESEDDLEALSADRVASSVVNYGRLNTKIESLAQLSAMEGVRADIALLSLGRAYVNRCTERGGEWTSELHLFWWVRGRLADAPVVEVFDIRAELGLSLARQLELASWAVMMLRLIFLSDVGSHAERSGHRVRELSVLAEQAALETRELSFKRLHRWVKTRGVEILDKALPEGEYRRLAMELHREGE